MDCPICGGAAEDITPRTFDGKSIRCSNCATYDITGTVWEPGMLQRLEPEQRRNALDRAKQLAGANKRPTITSYCL